MSASVESPYAESNARPSLTAPLARVFAFVAPTGLLTGMFYYFGNVSARSFYGYFGISLSTLDLPASHYFIQTADALFRPMAAVALLSLCVFGVHILLESASLGGGGRTGRLITGGLILASVPPTTVGLVGLFSGRGGAPSAFSLAAGVIIWEYALWLGLHTSALKGRLATMAESRVGMRRGILLAILLIAIFWGITVLAHNRGTLRAQIVEATLPIQPQAVVYSTQPLHISGTGVGMTRLDGGEGGAAFLYNGLRPLIYAHDRWFLVPKGWRRDNGDTVVLLRDSPDQIRVDLAPGQ